MITICDELNLKIGDKKIELESYDTVLFFRGHSSKFWIGLIAGNGVGECLWWSRKKMVGKPRPVDGEALAIVHGIYLAK